MKILFLHRSLTRGGAERQLVATANGLAERGHAVALALSYGGGAFHDDLRDEIAVHVLEKRGRYDLLGFFFRLRQLLAAEKPNILCTWLPSENLVSAVCKLVNPRLPVVWGIRSAFADLTSYDRITGWTYRLEPHFARFADLVIANSWAGRSDAIKRGFPKEKLRVIANGIDVQRFRPRPESRVEYRRAWGVGAEHVLVGIVGRLDPAKDHLTFFRAAAQVAAVRPAARFLCVGDEGPITRKDLMATPEVTSLRDRIVWLDGSSDMAGVFSTCDIVCMTSRFEGFPNVLAEAMACGTPCVSTNVGDAAQIMGDAGTVVPAGEPAEVAQALLRIIDLSPAERSVIGARARERILSEFTVPMAVRAFEEAFVSLTEAPQVQSAAGSAAQGRDLRSGGF